MGELTFEIGQNAYIKLVLHALKHKSSAVNGVLVGRYDAGKGIVQISDAVPLFHSNTALLPSLEIALMQVCSFSCHLLVKFHCCLNSYSQSYMQWTRDLICLVLHKCTPLQGWKQSYCNWYVLFFLYASMPNLEIIRAISFRVGRRDSYCNWLCGIYLILQWVFTIWFDDCENLCATTCGVRMSKLKTCVLYQIYSNFYE